MFAHINFRTNSRRDTKMRKNKTYAFTTGAWKKERAKILNFWVCEIRFFKFYRYTQMNCWYMQDPFCEFWREKFHQNFIIHIKIRGRSCSMGNTRPECFPQKSLRLREPLFFRSKFWQPLFFPYKFNTPFFTKKNQTPNESYLRIIVA